jgi:hypothetical protein
MNDNCVEYDENIVPINARLFTFSCIHCGNQWLIQTCDDEYWCYKCREYVMVNGI